MRVGDSVASPKLLQLLELVKTRISGTYVRMEPFHLFR